MKEGSWFVPQLEELHVGYECYIEGKNSNWDFVVWPKIAGDKVDLELKFNDLLLNSMDLRTHYLTNGQILRFGFEKVNVDANGFTIFRRGNILCGYLERTQHLSILFAALPKDNEAAAYRTLYEGRCKSINEFRKIIKDVIEETPLFTKSENNDTTT